MVQETLAERLIGDQAYDRDALDEARAGPRPATSVRHPTRVLTSALAAGSFWICVSIVSRCAASYFRKSTASFLTLGSSRR